MKATHLFLKKIGILSIATLLIAGCTSDPQKQDEPTPPSPEIPEESEEPEEPVDDLTAFFYKHMNGETALWSDSEPISADQIVAKREEVWNLWKKACESYNEEKLIALNTLGSNSTGRWKLPANLEPNATMPYYWGTKGTEPADGYPLFLYLHGSGDKDSEWITGLNICSGFDDAPSAYFIPQIPNTGNYYRWWQKAKQFAWEKLLRLAFASGKIDPDRVYFFGISEGGYGSQRLASFYADYLAGAGPMAGGEPLKNAPVENCRNIAFSLRTGANDNGFFRNTLTQYTKDEFDRLQSANPGSFEHNIQLIPGMGHGIDYSPTTPWLKNYTRDPYPKTVSWENFEMDGLYRDGFYNLYVNERSNNDANSRSYYEMSITGNAITLNVQTVKYQTTETNSGIDMKFAKTYTPATKGKITVYLSPELVDMAQPVTLTVNGKTAFNDNVGLDTKHLINSCGIFFDPERLYPAAIEVDLSAL